jgi:hypothetical protein
VAAGFIQVGDRRRFGGISNCPRYEQVRRPKVELQVTLLVTVAVNFRLSVTMSCTEKVPPAVNTWEILEAVPEIPFPPLQPYWVMVPPVSFEVDVKVHDAREQLLVKLAVGGWATVVVVVVVLGTVVVVVGGGDEPEIDASLEKGPVPAPSTAWTS